MDARRRTWGGLARRHIERKQGGSFTDHTKKQIGPEFFFYARFWGKVKGRCVLFTTHIGFHVLLPLVLF